MELFQFLEANLEAMERRNHSAAKWLRGRNLDLKRLEKQLLVNAFGLVDLPTENGASLFGAIPPQAFYGKWQPDERAAKGATIMVGCNLGYGLNHVLTTFPASHVVGLIEPDPEMLATCLAMTDYRPFIEQGRLEFVAPNHEPIWNFLSRQDLRFIHGAIYFRSDVPSQQLSPEYAKTSNLTEKAIDAVSIELATLRRMQDVMVGNEIANFRSAFQRGTVRPLENSAKGVTGLIVGAGPSLAELGPEIAKHCSDALVVTAMQSLPAVQSVGIRPDLCMAIDYSPGILGVFKRLDREWASTIPFIYSTKVQREVVEQYPGPTIPMWTLGGLATHMMRDREPVFDAGGNVSVSLMRLLEWCGVSRFVLAGQDFAWKGEKSHAVGHHANAPTRKFDPSIHIRLQNMHGEEIISTMSYITAQRDMEADALRTDIPVYNIYGGGMGIDGTEAVTVDEAVSRKLMASEDGANESFMRSMASARTPQAVPVFEPRAGEWGASLRAVQKRLTKLYKKAVGRQREINETLEQVLMFLKQDPLYMPYLYNEFMDLAGITRLTERHRRQELSEVKRILARVLHKVREIDDALGSGRAVQAA